MTVPTHPLIDRLTRELGYPELTVDNRGSLTAKGTCCLFFSGDPQRIRDATDLAVVLPELVQANNGRFVPMVVSRDDERDLQKIYGFQQWPALVFLRDGQYLGALERIRDWADYREEIPALLDAQARRAPGIGIAVTAAPARQVHNDAEEQA